MAELLIAEGYSPPDRFAVRLREDVPDGYVAVAGAQVQGQTCDAIVVASKGMIVLHSDDMRQAADLDTGDPDASIPGHAPEGQGIDRLVQQSNRALSAFLSDEFPEFSIEIRHLAVSDEAVDTDKTFGSSCVRVVALDHVGEAVLSTTWTSNGQPLSDEQQFTLAEALSERRLTSRQRASAPFTFRSSGRLGRSHSVWTIRELVAYLDRDPSAGGYHLRNGTLVRWLEEQGAAHMARHAREAMREPSADSRAVLEDFLLRSGLVERPQLVVKPSRVDLGAIATGETASAGIRIACGGRGYLAGSVRGTEPWVRVEPRRFADGEYLGTVSVDTSSLPIRSEAYETNVEVISNAAETPYSIPVRFKVTSAYNVRARYTAWTIAVGLAVAVLGWFVGWLWGAYALPVFARQLGGNAGSGLGLSEAPAGWALLVAAVWALVGAFHASRTDNPRLIGTSALPWIGYVVAWIAILFTFFGGPVWLITEAFADIVAIAGPSIALVTGLTGALFAIFPASLIAMPTRKMRVTQESTEQGTVRVKRLVNFAVIGVTAMAVVLVTLSWRSVGPWRSSAESWLVDQSGTLEQRLDAWTDGMTLRFHDRRAPALPTLVPIVETEVDSEIGANTEAGP